MAEWNCLPSVVREARSIETFKNQIEPVVLEEIPNFCPPAVPTYNRIRLRRTACSNYQNQNQETEYFSSLDILSTSVIMLTNTRAKIVNF